METAGGGKWYEEGWTMAHAGDTVGRGGSAEEVSAYANALATLERAVEAATNESIDSLRRVPIDERRNRVERITGRTLAFISRFPFIGRGNVMRDRLVSHSAAETSLTEALRAHGTD